jgi:hypothetical protein
MTISSHRAVDLLGTDPRPAFFPVANARDLGLGPPESRGGIAVRTWVRALSGMQKEALVTNGATGRTWRLVSDEGPYLAGHDRAPCPLCHFVTGMVSSYMNQITALAVQRDMDTHGLGLTLENFYTMEGSALKGTMIGGALNPRLSVEIPAAEDTMGVQELVAEAASLSPLNGLLTDTLDSRFTLHHNGQSLPVGRVEALGAPALPDPGDRFDGVAIADVATADDLMIRLRPADEVEGLPGGVNSSLQESQSRSLHVRGRCVVREDGVKEIDEDLIRPIGSDFRFLSDEVSSFDGTGRAPDAVTYVSAGIGFCFMTQFGRYARITKKQLDEYRIVQDTHFYPGDQSRRGRMDPVETHVYLVSPEDVEFARRTLDMGEQTCFLHATCRSELGIDIAVSVGQAPHLSS